MLFSPGVLGPWFVEHGLNIIFGAGDYHCDDICHLAFCRPRINPRPRGAGRFGRRSGRLSRGKRLANVLAGDVAEYEMGLLYGIILCSARSIGEFGAVSVVSGRIRGLTNTMPLHVEILYNEYQFSAAFAVASLMSILAVITLIMKSFMEWKTEQRANREVH